tara:strand:- start:2090 stop:2656 length:567 start_codon:yes stop_codon:yes gene_type:complete
MGLIIFVSVVVLLAIFIVSTYNTIVSRKNNVKRTWADVLVYERKKNQVLPKFEELLNDYKEQESSLLEKITTLRTAVGSLSEKGTTREELKSVEALSVEVKEGLKVAVEAYPELKSSALYAQVMTEFSELQNDVAASLSIFNSSVETFNTTIESFPGSLVNHFFNKERPVDVFSDSVAQSGFEYRPGI